MKSIAFLFALFFLGACTITKRVHNAGWHVEWNNSQKHLKQDAGELSLTVSTRPIQAPTISSNEITSEVSKDEFEQASAALHQQVQLEVTQGDGPAMAVHKNDFTNQHFSETHVQDSEIDSLQEPTDSDNRKRWQPNLTGSIVFLVIAYILFGVTLLTGGVLGFVVAAFISALLSLVFAVRAWQYIKRNPERWKGKVVSIILIIAGIQTVLGLIGVFLLIRLLNFGGIL
jgi:cation transport ATPase